jgi:hypothetical protein
VKAARANRERARCGCTQFVWVADIGWTHRASSPLRSRKASWDERALAGRKSVAPPDVGRGWVEGESVRVRRISNKFSCARPAGFGLQVRDTMKGVLGLLPVLLSPAGRSRVLWLAGQHRITIREERDAGQHIGRTRNPTRVCLRVTKGTSEVDTVRSRLFKDREGPRGVRILGARKGAGQRCAGS